VAGHLDATTSLREAPSVGIVLVNFTLLKVVGGATVAGAIAWGLHGSR
jgi:hypothetical protein